MSMLQIQVGAVKTALGNGSATQSTVTTLQSLLSAETKAKDSAKDVATSRPTKRVADSISAARASKPSAKTTRKDQAVKVLDDEPPGLATKERHALATDVVNITLKALTASLKARPKQHDQDSPVVVHSSTDATTPKRQRALQPRSVNATPTKQSSVEGKESRQTQNHQGASNTTQEPSPTITATAECARLAFAFLRSSNTQKLGVRAIPALQLENGMLALANKLHANGLESLATKELRILKQKIENFGRLKSASQAEKETLASLLRLDLDLKSQQDVLPLAIAYQQLVLRVISTAGKPASVESSSDFLDLTVTTSPANLIIRQGEISGDLAKTGKLLEVLSSSILAMCPSISAKADSLAINAETSPVPEACLRLQTIGFSIRKLWWTLVGHQPDLEQELFAPLSRCILAFVRRSTGARNANDVYTATKIAVESVLAGYEAVGSGPLFTIHRTLASLAENSSDPDDAMTWTAHMVEDVRHLDRSHAQRIAVSAKQLSSPVSEEATTSSLSDVMYGLKENMSGSSADYECLMAELASFLPAIRSKALFKSDAVNASKFVELSASFAQRFARSYPGRGLVYAQAILQSALRHTSQSDDATAWLTMDSVKVFVDAGTLKTIACAASSLPTERAWSISSESLTLARILRLLATRAVKCASEPNSSSIFDDESMSSLERGLALELQLKSVLELASRTKYHGNITKLLPEILRRLHVVYVTSTHPVRRAFIATELLRFREVHAELLPPHRLQVWLTTDLDLDKMGQDEGLRDYAPDVGTSLQFTRLYHKGSPSVISMRPLLAAWERMLDTADGTDAEEVIYDPASLAAMLKSVSAYLGALGEDVMRLVVQAMLLKLNQAPTADVDEKIEASVELARQWHLLGYGEKAGSLIAQAQKLSLKEGCSALSRIKYCLAHAEHRLTVDDAEKCETTLAEVRELRESLPPKDVPRRRRATYERIHAEAWLTQSRFCSAKGLPTDALAAAKHAVKLLNSTWHRLEKGTTVDTPSLEAAEEPVDNEFSDLASGVSKLKLTPISNDSEPKQPETKGAAFWPLIPLLCKALTHLSNMYAQHGLFSESNYYSTKATEIAESAGSKILLLRARSHRARLLASAGKIEDAELCLTMDDDVDIPACSLAGVERLEAQAFVRAKEGSPEESQKLYNKAQEVLREMQTEDLISRLGQFEARPIDLASQVASMTLDDKVDQATAAPKKAVGRTKPAAKVKAPVVRKVKGTAAEAPSRARSAMDETSVSSAETTCYLLEKRRANICLDAALALAGTDQGSPDDLNNAIEKMKHNARELLKQRCLQYHALMHKANASLQADFTYNILPESTLAFPALLRSASGPDEAKPLPSKPGSTARSAAKATVRKADNKPEFGVVLQEARQCLLSGFPTLKNFSSVSTIHSEGALLTGVSMLFSASDNTAAKQTLQSTSVGLTLDFGRIHAAQSEQTASAVDTQHNGKGSPFQWPSTSNTSTSPMLSALHFQNNYINILPIPWTALSLALSPDTNDLYISRYRSGQSPFILRVPFARHKPEDLGEETFDYAAGKAELQDIIRLSNYSCHNNGSENMTSKGAKSNWWTEREALDRRLQELLINIEEIWFGGFRGVLSPRQRRVELLARFRKSFEGMLDRHLPSRQAAKGRAEKLALSNDVLELFINLGNDHDGTLDLDDPVADLLYFVVDMLQFNGERNAYDEMDFDSMAVEVLDALRAYHDACGDADEGDRHLVLVLDKRLQAFPWESMPCLEGVSVSRVGSMQSLRDCILAMRAQQGNCGVDRYAVSRQSGSYILNPSADLASTQAVLEPALAKAPLAGSADWSSIIKRAPSEDEFKAALESSSMMLYFGHGAGSQYIRPRTIRKLDHCSEVVWLMGCSSGAVTEYGELEPQAVPLAYLMAGGSSDSASSPEDSQVEQDEAQKRKRCLSVLATLWDVTDKDIDRFSLAVGEEWGLWPPSVEQPTKLPAKTPKKRDKMVAPSTPPQVPKTPKTPKAKKTPAPAAKTPARSRSRVRFEVNKQQSLVEAVAKSRESCYLRYLNGAAPVVYGVPVYLGE